MNKAQTLLSILNGFYGDLCCNIVKYYYNIYSCDDQVGFSAAITPIFSVT